MTASIISMLLRCETYLGDTEDSKEALRKGLQKEIQASQNRKEPAKINYGGFFGGGIPLSNHIPLLPAWESTARYFADRLAGNLVRLGLQFPKVQRKKNMAMESQNALLQRGYESERSYGNWTTLDLELYKAQSGVAIAGGCEMRWAWRYNDLKPRCYYCIGGENYWPSRFIRRIAIEFMNTIPITHVARRSNPSGIISMMASDDTVVMWDLTSFTTNLSELKLFLHYVCEYLKNDLRAQQHPISVLDYGTGITDIHIADLLETYNESVNFHSSFSIHRVLADLDILDMDIDTILEQQNSGMLGVPGNIGFSTAFHGLYGLGPATSKDSGVGVGDDEMMLIPSQIDPDAVLHHIEEIGEINVTKFGIFLPSEDEDGWKFLKRPFRRNAGDNGLYFGYLFDIPILAYVFGVSTEGRKFFEDRDPLTIVRKFVTQAAKILWDVLSFSHLVTDNDLDLLLRLLQVAYRKLRLPISGALPGYKMHGDTSKRLYLAVPSLYFDYYDPRQVDWADWLWTNTTTRFCILPRSGSRRMLPSLYPGLEFDSIQDKYVQVLRDLGIISKGSIQSEWVEVDERNYNHFRHVVRGCNPIYRFTVLKNVPYYHFDVVDKFYSVLDDPDRVLTSRNLHCGT